MNRYSLSFHPDVPKDLQKGYDYYFEEVSFETAERFLDAVDEAFDTLEINPFYEVRTKNLRAFPLANYPYIILFEVFPKTLKVEVRAVFNTNQSPKKYPQ